MQRHGDHRLRCLHDLRHLGIVEPLQIPEREHLGSSRMQLGHGPAKPIAQFRG